MTGKTQLSLLLKRISEDIYQYIDNIVAGLEWTDSRIISNSNSRVTFNIIIYKNDGEIIFQNTYEYININDAKLVDNFFHELFEEFLLPF